jgi:hypothetical protein
MVVQARPSGGNGLLTVAHEVPSALVEACTLQPLCDAVVRARCGPVVAVRELGTAQRRRTGDEGGVACYELTVSQAKNRCHATLRVRTCWNVLHDGQVTGPVHLLDVLVRGGPQRAHGPRHAP